MTGSEKSGTVEPTAAAVKKAATDSLTVAGLDPKAIGHLIDLALEEDLDGGVDVTTVATVPAEQRSRLSFVARANGVLAGVDVAALVFAEVAHRADAELSLEIHSPDATEVEPGDTVFVAESLTSVLLTAERTALNFLGHLSGVATAAHEWATILDGSGTYVRDTRKTTPGYRALEKYAVRCGGGKNHRMSLSDAALVKDNHVIAAGGVPEAFALVREKFPDIALEIEVDNFDQLQEALEAGAHTVMVDNFAIADMVKAAKIVKEFNEANSRDVKLEASGGLTLKDAPALATTGVDYVAIGALTHSARVLDIGADLEDIATLAP